ncbi:hypothetical protein AYO47_03300 [Planctomyces sp. SCGC AG-212-M04]|nr:hypothetical protein AYO47_03300 [Planctomyces sp. SCGC AG-212-M04]
MHRNAIVWVIGLGLFFCSLRATADVIRTAGGEAISGRESKVVDGQIIVPGAEGTPEQKFDLADLEQITFAPGRPSGELKTRIVRIDEPGAGKPMSLAEVQLFVGNKNVALEGKARQSLSYLDDDEMWGAQKAIDGKTGGDSRNDGATRTMPAAPWWEVTLPQDAVIEKLIVWGRTDGQPNTRPSELRVQFLNEQRQVLWVKKLKAPNPKEEVATPVHSDKLKPEDLKAIEGLGTVKTARPLATIVDAWIRDVKVVVPETPMETGAATPVRRGGIGGFSAEAPPQNAAAAAPTAPFPDGEWLVRFEPGGFVVGKIASWNDSGLKVEFNLLQKPLSLTIPTAAVLEVSSKEVVMKKLPLDRAQIPAEGDVVFAKAEGNVLQPVAGTVKGIVDDSLQFEFQGRVRGIKLARVGSIMRKPTVTAAEKKVYGLLELNNGMRLAGAFQKLDHAAGEFQLPWQQSLNLEKLGLAGLEVREGRSVSMTTLDPEVKYTPYLDRIQPLRVNESLTGGKLAIGDKNFERGLCAHSGTTITYALDGGYDKLRVQIGLQNDDGARGQAVVRIKADDAVLAEKPVAGKAKAEVVDVSVAGKKSLVFEIDYGDGLDVGDHVVLGDPLLIRTAAK